MKIPSLKIVFYRDITIFIALLITAVRPLS